MAMGAFPKVIYNSIKVAVLMKRAAYSLCRGLSYRRGLVQGSVVVDIPAAVWGMDSQSRYGVSVTSTKDENKNFVHPTDIDYCTKDYTRDVTHSKVVDNSSAVMTPEQFHHIADIYLGGLWNRFESQLRKSEGESYPYTVEMVDGCLRLNLDPHSGSVTVEKHPHMASLIVKCAMPSVAGGGCGESMDVAEFQYSHEEVDFIDGPVRLHEFLEQYFAEHLKVLMDLSPKVNGPG